MDIALCMCPVKLKCSAKILLFPVFSDTDLTDIGNLCVNMTACSQKAASGVELTMFCVVRHKNTYGTSHTI